MVDEVAQQGGGGQYFMDMNIRIRDMEEKQRLLRDRMLLIGESFVKEREKSFGEMVEMKKTMGILIEENRRLKEMLVRVGEVTAKAARKEELMILQRQFDLFRGT